MSDMLGAWGRWVYRFRWWLLAASALSLAPASVILIQGAQLEAGTMLTTTESGRAASLMARQLPGQPVSFELILSSATLRATDRAFRDEVQRALAPLKADPRVARVRTPYDVSPPDPAMLSRDGHRARVLVELAVRASGLVTLGFSSVSPEVYASLRAKVQSRTLEVVGAGMLAINHDFVEVAKRDLKRAELVILPVVVVFLLLAFGSVVAALLPLGVGVLAMIGGIAGTELLARHMSVSAYAPNIVTMIGLGVAIDYSLAIGLLGMLALGLGNIGSLGLAGTIVVALSVLYGLTFLPAALAILGPHVNALSLPRLGFLGLGDGSGFWHRLAALVMTHPWRFFLPAAALLLLLGQPFLHIRLGAGDVTALPRWAEARRGAELLAREFPSDDETPIIVVLSYREGSPLSPPRVGEVYDLSHWLVKLPGVTAVRSLLDLSPDMSREDYQRFVKIPQAMWPSEMQEAVSRMVGERIMVLAVSTSHSPGSDEARALVRAIRASHPPVDGEVLITGATAFDLDFMGVVQRNAPFAIALVVVATYAALLVLLGSVLLPLKAVIVNLLSISASYGALVWIFQDGHLSRWLDFTPGSIQTATPIIMFCLIFGLSMDYEVLLLSRVREEYERTGDNILAVGAGLERTGRLITWAGAIMAAVFFAFALADSVIIKAVGVGIGIAVVLDATVVRALLVPATMRLMGTWNWWVPGPMARLARMARPEMGQPAARGVSADGGRGISSRRRP